MRKVITEKLFQLGEALRVFFNLKALSSTQQRPQIFKELRQFKHIFLALTFSPKYVLEQLFPEVVQTALDIMK